MPSHPVPTDDVISRVFIESSALEQVDAMNSEWKVLVSSQAKPVELQDTDHEQDADQPNPTCPQKTTYPANRQAKEEVACVELHRSLEQSLQHIWACIIILKDRSRDALKQGNDFGLWHFTDVPVVIEITLISYQIGSSMIRNRTPSQNFGC
ncbi:hypothetical protein TNCV_3102621 [Trichonephila clavipes]|nr:hypothetical protein TNCV_3102621 [Trichonephila clavipes]